MSDNALLAISLIATATVILPSYFGYRFGYFTFESSVVALLTAISVFAIIIAIGVTDD